MNDLVVTLILVVSVVSIIGLALMDRTARAIENVRDQLINLNNRMRDKDEDDE